MKLDSLIKKIKRKITHLRLKPIRVYCLHHVSNVFDGSFMHEEDWVSMERFQAIINGMRGNGVEFISLSEAYRHIKHDWFRVKKYVVLTFDDGYDSFREVLPWLEKKHIPCAVFVNVKYLDGCSFREKPEEKYLTKDNLFSINDVLVEIGHHGWEHTDATQMTGNEFRVSLEKSIANLASRSNYIPFWAYTWGRHNVATDELLRVEKIIPVLMDGMMNFSDSTCVHRELLPD